MRQFLTIQVVDVRKQLGERTLALHTSDKHLKDSALQLALANAEVVAVR